MEENVLFTPGKQSSVPKSDTSVQSSQSKTEVVASALASPPPPISDRPNIIGLILKILIPLILLGVIGFLIFRFVLPMFTGGGKNGDVTLTYWGLWDSDGVMKTIIDDFEKDHPNIKIKYEQRDIDRYRETLQTRVANGDGPDIFLYHNSWTPVFASLLAPLSSDVMSPEEFEKVYYPVVQKDLVRQGAIYGIPTGIDTLALFVNNSIFDETGASVPITWNDFIKVASGVSVKDGDNSIKTYGAGFGAYDNVNRAADIMSMLFGQSNVNLFSPDASKGNIAEALRFYTNFVTGGDNIDPVWNTSAPNAIIAFAGGDVAMYFGYSWDVFVIKELNPELDFSVYPVPSLDPNNKMTVASYWVNGISSKSQNQQAAQEFMKYLAQKETQEKLYTESSKVRLFGLPPARRDMASLVADNPLVAPFVNQAETATSSYFVSDTHDEGLNSQMNEYLGNAIRSMLGNTSAESAAETLVSGMNQVLSQYGLK